MEMTSNRISISGSTRALPHRALMNVPLVASVALLLFAAGTLTAARPTPTPTPVVTPTPTPAGLTGKIAYSCSGICLFNLANGTNPQIATSGVNPKISPDGTRIVFQGCGGICVMNADGTNPTTVSNFGGVPSWSPATIQPPQIAFSSNLNSPDDDLWSMNLDGSNARQILARAGEDLDLVWSFSGQIVFGGSVDQRASYEIFAFNPGTLSLNRLTNSPKQDFEPAASPDGSMIAFSSFRNPAGIYIMNADGSSQRLIIAGGR